MLHRTGEEYEEVSSSGISHRCGEFLSCIALDALAVCCVIHSVEVIRSSQGELVLSDLASTRDILSAQKTLMQHLTKVYGFEVVDNSVWPVIHKDFVFEYEIQATIAMNAHVSRLRTREHIPS